MRRSFWAAAAAAALVATGLLLWRFTASPPAVEEPPVQLTDFTDSVVMPSLSHDGRMLTFIRGVDFGRTAPTQGRVYVKLLPAGEPVELTTGEGGGYPTFSPDDARIVFTKVSKGSWDSWEVPVLGGPPQPFLPNASGLLWLDARNLVYSSIKAGLHMGIVAWDPSRSELREIYFPQNVGGMAHRNAPSPDGRSLLVIEMLRAVWQPCRLVPLDRFLAGPAGRTVERAVHERGVVTGRPLDVPSHRMPAAPSICGASAIPSASPNRSCSVRRNRKAPRSRLTAGISSRAWALSARRSG